MADWVTSGSARVTSVRARSTATSVSTRASCVRDPDLGASLVPSPAVCLAIAVLALKPWWDALSATVSVCVEAFSIRLGLGRVVASIAELVWPVGATPETGSH